MAYDEQLADRIRELVADEPGATETAMFGGLAFLVGGHMAVVASGQGGIMVRVGRTSDALIAETDADAVVMRGRAMRGWVRVDPAHLRTREQLATWVELGTTYAWSLPPKHAG